jgi:peroxiredoxin
MVIAIGASAPPVPGTSPEEAHALLFYKVTCPTCQMAAPPLDRFEQAYPGRMYGVGQDPASKLAEFSAEFGATFPSVSDAEPYPASSAYGIENVPTMVVVDGDGRVADVVESWDRDGYNRASTTLAGLLGRDPVVISDARDGLPAFRPG